MRLNIIILIFITNYIIALLYSTFCKTIKTNAKKCGDKYTFLTGTARGPFKIVLLACWISIFASFPVMFFSTQLFDEDTAKEILKIFLFVIFIIILPILDICVAILLGIEIRKYMTKEEVKEDVKRQAKIIGWCLGIGLFLAFFLSRLLGGLVTAGGKDMFNGTKSNARYQDTKTGNLYDEDGNRVPY